jgi:hypothetical protein
MQDWDRENPDMSVGIIYPSMDEFRLAMRQHAIKGQFEYNTEHSFGIWHLATCLQL